MMRERLFRAAYLVIVIFALNACCISECRNKEYGLLESAVTFSSDKVYGEYGENIPNDFDSVKFMALVEGKIPEDYYEALKGRSLEVIPKKSYYLLKVYDKGVLILFDYSCTSALDGPVLTNPGKYDATHLEIYDKCTK